MLKRHKQRFLGDLHVDQQKLRAQLEVLRSDVEAFSELGDIAQVCACAVETPWHALQSEGCTVTADDKVSWVLGSIGSGLVVDRL